MNRSAYDFDVVVVGGGPAGSSCAAFCAQEGMRTVILERASFPREKVCGDCLNPIAWPVLTRLGVAERLLSLPHARLNTVEFIGCDQRKVTIALPESTRGEIAVKRSLLDQLLLERAAELGAEVRERCMVSGVKRTSDGWALETSHGTVTGQFLVAADGRNSTVARLLGLQPAAQRDRVGLQTHIPRPNDMGERVRMQFAPEGYTGLADIGDEQGNLCLVARPGNIERLRTWAAKRYGLPLDQPWRTITPLSRAPIPPSSDRLLLIGDAARVVEPFTGEGIAYALLSGEHAARALISDDLHSYQDSHARLYRGRLWINRVAKAACLYPRLATKIVALGSIYPGLFRVLTHKVIQGSQPE